MITAAWLGRLRAVWIPACVALSMGATSSRAASSISNLDLMKQLTERVVAPMLDSVRVVAPTLRIRLQPFASGDEKYRFVTNVLLEVMKERQFDPEVDSAGGQNAIELRFQLLAFDLAYTDVYRAHLIGGKRVRREAAVRLLATLVDPATGSVLWTGERLQDATDHFRAGELGRVEAGTFAFVRPGMPGSGWGKYAEPVLVSGIVVGLVYLFFSNQID